MMTFAWREGPLNGHHGMAHMTEGFGERRGACSKPMRRVLLQLAERGETRERVVTSTRVVEAMGVGGLLDCSDGYWDMDSSSLYSESLNHHDDSTCQY